MQNIIANLTFHGSGMRIGEAKAIEIMQTAIYGLDPATTFVAKDIHTKILAQIPRVGRDTAVLILASVELTTICEVVIAKNQFSMDDMADRIGEIQRANGKKIGKAAGKMIVEVLASEPASIVYDD